MATADIVPLAGELSGNRETVGWLRVSVERSVIPDRVSRNERSELRGMLCPENGTKNVAGTARKNRSAINDNGPRRRRPDEQTRAGPSTAESSANNECHESGPQPAAQARVSRSGRPRCSKRDSRNLPLKRGHAPSRSSNGVAKWQTAMLETTENVPSKQARVRTSPVARARAKSRRAPSMGVRRGLPDVREKVSPVIPKKAPGLGVRGSKSSKENSCAFTWLILPGVYARLKD